MIKGIAFKVASTLAFAVMAALVKALSTRVALAEIVLFRSLFSMATLAVWLRQQGAFPHGLKTGRPLGHFGRSVAGVLGMFGTFAALSLLPIAKATALGFVTPLMVVPLATVVLGEPARVSRWAAVAAGFAGVIVMLSDRLFDESVAPESTLGESIALATAFISAVATIQVRRLTRTERTGAIVFYFFLAGCIASAGALLVGAFASPTGPLAAVIRWSAPDGPTLAALALLGVLGGMGQILMTQSFRLADAAVTAAFDYTSILWTAAIGALVFGETLTWNVAIGAAVVIGAGLTILGHERARETARRSGGDGAFAGET